MSAERIEAIRKRLVAAQNGPWAYARADRNAGIEPIIVTSRDGLHADGSLVAKVGRNRQAKYDDQQYADAQFIANAPDDIAYLLAEVERLTEALAPISGEIR